MKRLEKIVEALESDHGPSVKEIRDELEKDGKETKEHILGLRSRMDDVLNRKYRYMKPNWEGADTYNQLMDNAFNNVTDSVSKSTQTFLDKVSDLSEMSDRMNK